MKRYFVDCRLSSRSLFVVAGLATVCPGFALAQSDLRSGDSIVLEITEGVRPESDTVLNQSQESAKTDDQAKKEAKKKASSEESVGHFGDRQVATVFNAQIFLTH